MRKLTVALHIHFNDLHAENTDDAAAAVKSALCEMEAECHGKLGDALESIGARDVKIDMVVY